MHPPGSQVYLPGPAVQPSRVQATALGSRQFGSLPLPASADRDAHAMGEPGALTAAINWYVWSDGDIFVLANGARVCGPPSRCPAGHQLGPGRMLGGTSPC